MNKTVKSYFIIFGHLVIGLIIILLVQQIDLPSWLNATIAVFLAFFLINLIEGYAFKLQNEIREFWSIKKIHYLFIGVIGGGLISIIPTALELLTTKLSLSDFTYNSNVSVSAILLTLAIVGWEELWFRGIFLNKCNKYLSPVNISLTIGFLFMVIHILNPKIDLVKTGPSLFFAGALLTILYFYYKTFWLPVGLHFGNNFVQKIIEVKSEESFLFGKEGYMGAIILAGLYFIYARKVKRNSNSKTRITPEPPELKISHPS